MAATKLVEQLSRDLLECGICLDRFKKPKALPCMHCFCEECLERYCKGQTQVLCPTCKQPTYVPIHGVCAFPAHFIVNTLQDTIDKVKDNAMDDPPCINCPDKKATVRCFDCNELFCDDCHGSHNSWNSMKAHTVVSVKDLRSGKVLPPLATTVNQICKDHDGERKKFYCDTCGIPICRDCIVLDHRQHKYISLKEASKNQLSKMQDIAQKLKCIKEKYIDAIKQTEKVEKRLETASQNIKKKLQEIKGEYLKQVEDTFKQHEENAASMVVQRAMKLGDIKNDLQTKLAKVKSTCELVSTVIEMGSDYDIISIFPTLVSNFEEGAMITEPDIVNDNLGIISVTTSGKVEIPDVVTIVKGETWNESGQFSTKCKGYPSGIAINQDGDVAVTFGYNETVNVFSVDGNVKCTFRGPFSVYPWDIAVTPDNTYILSGDKELLFYDEHGNRLRHPKAATYDMNNELSGIESIAVDSKSRIIVGMKGNTISIHHADGKPISKFATPATPRTRGLDITSAGNIAATFDDKTLKVMDYSGNNVKVVQPPHGVSRWVPWYVSCSKQGEIFVVNRGDPLAVFRYTADGDDCLGCVTTFTGPRNDPSGIDITKDGQQLCVVECNHSLVTIFQRC